MLHIISCMMAMCHTVLCATVMQKQSEERCVNRSEGTPLYNQCREELIAKYIENTDGKKRCA